MTNNCCDLRETARIMRLAILCLFGVLLIVGELIILLLYPFEPPLAFALGLMLGSGLSVLKSVLLTRSVETTAGGEEKQAAVKAGLHFVLRYGLTIAVLAFVVLLNEFVGLFGAIAGILTLQFSAYITNRVIKHKYPDVPVPATKAEELPENKMLPKDIEII